MNDFQKFLEDLKCNGFCHQIISFSSALTRRIKIRFTRWNGFLNSFYSTHRNRVEKFLVARIFTLFGSSSSTLLYQFFPFHSFFLLSFNKNIVDLWHGSFGFSYLPDNYLNLINSVMNILFIPILHYSLFFHSFHSCTYRYNF